MKILVVFKKTFESAHDRCMERVESACRSAEQAQRASFTLRPRDLVVRSDFEDRDMIIVVGGDGTLTSIAHNVGSDVPVLGVNSHPIAEDPEGSVGFYLDSDAERFEEHLDRALNGDVITNVVPRLQATIVTTSGNTIRSDPALNDLFVANTQAYSPSRYRIQRADASGSITLDERHLSSGLLCSTWLGRGAWLDKAADLSCISFQASQLQTHYLVHTRDLPVERHHSDDLAWLDWTEQPTVITSDMHRGFVVSDGWDEYAFNRGAVITIGLSGPTLRLITFEKELVES